MSFNFGIGDVLACTKLAWDLYHQCYVVARNAPDSFRQLVNELNSLHMVLRDLRDEANSDTAYLDRLDQRRKETLKSCIESCCETLNQLQRLVDKYRDLGSTDGRHFWKRLKYTTAQSDIAALKSRIMAQTCTISLCVTSIGNSSLARYGESIMEALAKQNVPEQNRNTTSGIEQSPVLVQDGHKIPDDESLASSLTLRRTRTSPTRRANSVDESTAGLGLGRAFTGQTLVDPSRLSSDSRSSVSGDNAQKKTPTPSNKLWTPPTGSSFSHESAHKPFPLSPDTTPSPIPSLPDIPDEAPKSSRAVPKRFAHRINSSPSRPTFGVHSQNYKPTTKPFDLEGVITEAMAKLATIKAREASMKPLRVPEADPAHQPDEELKRRFQKLADDEAAIRPLNVKDWLLVGTWWLIKSRFDAKAERMQLRNGKFNIPNRDHPNLDQAYVDLLKASWILRDIILDKQHGLWELVDEHRKLFYTLIDGISEDLDDFKAPDGAAKGFLLEQNYNIWEFRQPDEEAHEYDDPIANIENGRWITVEESDAGLEGESLIHRTFVNAAIGRKSHRMRSKGAPYMLHLSIKDGESEPKVTLCNQSSSLSITRDVCIGDLKPPKSTQNQGARLAALSPWENVQMDFGKLSVTMAFTSQQDYDDFMRIPKAYFEGVRLREPRQLKKATETLIFSRSVEIYERLNPSTMKPTSPSQQAQSCDLRVLETTCKEGWRTTRRLVVSSSAAEPDPWCKDFFLPMSRVQVRREERSVLMKWSDCTHERQTTDGSWHPLYTYYYDDSNPNLALALDFRHSRDAQDFQRTILRLSSNPIYEWTGVAESRTIYIVNDTEPNPKSYKALMLTHSRYDWQYSELYYLYRDIDFKFDFSSLRVHFPQLWYTDYISNFVERLDSPPPPSNPPQFSHCEGKIGNATVDFADPSTAMEFMSSLTPGHKLVYSRRAESITTKPASMLRKERRSKKGAAEIQLWFRGNQSRLMSRWGDCVDDKWLSMPVDPLQLEPKRDGVRLSLGTKVEYQRGLKLDLANLVASDNSSKEDKAKKEGPVIITFASAQDRTEFVKAVRRAPSTIGSQRKLSFQHQENAMASRSRSLTITEEGEEDEHEKVSSDDDDDDNDDNDDMSE